MSLNVVRHEAVHLYAAAPASAAREEATNAILRLHKAEQDAIEKARVASGLTSSEFFAIRFLLQAERDGRSFGPKDLAVMLAKSNAAVTLVVDRLEQFGLVERRKHPTDRRAQVLVPTELAAQRVEEAFRWYHSALVTVINAQPDADAECVARVLGAVFEELNSALS